MQERPSASVTLMAWHRIGILPTVLHRLEVKAGSIHARVLGALCWRHLFKFMGEFHQTSLFSFRRPQCVSFRVESTPRTWPGSAGGQAKSLLAGLDLYFSRAGPATSN